VIGGALNIGAAAVAGGMAAAAPAGGIGADAISALTGLGFKPYEASQAVAAAEAELGDEATLDALVRLALKKAAK
jgi:Holliday junction DNA helicase RuvA